jgi:hypothetical protein
MAAASVCHPLFAAADGRPPVTYPRATAADDAVEPDWDQRLEITVGPNDAQIVGANDRAIQAAVDYCTNMGGGTVRLAPGTYYMDNCVQLRTGTRIVGSGLDTVLMKNPSHTSPIVAESDWNDQEITLADDHQFKVGDGVCLRTKNPHTGGPVVLYRTLVAGSGGRFKVDRPLRESFWLKQEPTASALFPLIRGEFVTDIAIENLTLDGNRDHNDWLDGNYSGCVFMQECARVHLSNVEARHNNGDGLSWQICHDVFVTDCHVHGNKDLGLHPGSGSQRPLMRGNHIHDNGTGIYFCWGVKFGLAEKNRCIANGKGISIGHRDNENLVRDNDIIGSTEVGVLFRPERGHDYAPHRNTFENNRITDTGGDDAIAVDIQGEVEDIKLIGNQIRETRGPANRVGIKISEGARDIHLTDNTIEGFHTPVLDLRKA